MTLKEFNEYMNKKFDELRNQICPPQKEKKDKKEEQGGK